MKLVLVLATLGVVLGCVAPPSPAEVAAATLYVPPKVRLIDEPGYCFTSAERERALQEARQQDCNTVFELVIDAAGQVKKARVIRTQVRKEFHQDLVEHARHLEFSADPRGEGYRAFFLPMRLRYDASFEWIEPN